MFTFQFLGTGTSVGVPMIGCRCPVCTSTDPRDKRMRSALYVTLGDRAVLIDTPPDFREQALRFDLPRVDAVLFTHLHADHIFGFDDIRRFNTIQNNAIIPAYADPATLSGLRRIFPYIGETAADGLFRPLIHFHEVTAPFTLFGARITPLPARHGKETVTGYRIDSADRSLAYIPDCNAIPESTLANLADLDALILDALRDRPHRTHMSVSQALEVIARVKPRRAYLTHICHEISHADLAGRLPPAVEPAYDGLRAALS